DYEPLPAVVDLEEAIRPDAPTVWPDGLPDENSDLAAVHGATQAEVEAKNRLNNVHTERNYRRGDVAAGFAAADVVVENTFRMEMVHQGYLEPHASVAEPELFGRGV